MDIYSRRLRPLFMVVFAVMGGFAGSALATQYEAKLIELVGSRDPKLLWLFPINPTPLTRTEELRTYLVFIIVGVLLGFLLERVSFSEAVKIRNIVEHMAPHDKVAAGVGFIVGLVLTALIVSITKTPLWFNLLMAVVLCYVSMAALLSLKEQVRYFISGPLPVKPEDRAGYRPKLLDTNVIIDGRIADVCRAGFVEGPIYVPKFIVEELQQIADSSDSLKRARGRRGLEILTQMQKEMDLQVPDMSDMEPGEEVDAGLVRLARQVDGAIITNDYNLNKVAGLQGVDVLNVNELANALKPVVLPGEEMRVTIIKEGKEKEQGIGYLDDGTMIVVEGGRRRLDETLPVSVTSVLQTVQGKMIFAKIKDSVESGGGSVDQSIHSYAGGRSRRKTR